MTEDQALRLLGLSLPVSKQRVLDTFSSRMVELNNCYATSGAGKAMDELDSKKCDLMQARDVLLKVAQTQQNIPQPQAQVYQRKTVYPKKCTATAVPFTLTEIKNCISNLLDAVKSLHPEVIKISCAVLLASMVLATGKCGHEKASYVKVFCHPRAEVEYNGKYLTDAPCVNPARIRIRRKENRFKFINPNHTAIEKVFLLEPKRKYEIEVDFLDSTAVIYEVKNWSRR